ncbi:MAG TPA: hypothetical protein VIK33_10620 [Anaerolineae bacterium]
MTSLARRVRKQKEGWSHSAWLLNAMVERIGAGNQAMKPQREKPLPSCLMARPTVFDVLRERIEQDARIRPEIRAAVFLKSSQLIRERGITQI